MISSTESSCSCNSQQNIKNLGYNIFNKLQYINNNVHFEILPKKEVNNPMKKIRKKTACKYEIWNKNFHARDCITSKINGVDQMKTDCSRNIPGKQ